MKKYTVFAISPKGKFGVLLITKTTHRPCSVVPYYRKKYGRDIRAITLDSITTDSENEAKELVDKWDELLINIPGL